MKIWNRECNLGVATIALMGLLISAPGARAAEPEDKKEKPSETAKAEKAKGEKVKVYTNADLTSAPGSIPETAPVPDAPTAKSPGGSAPSAEEWVKTRRDRQLAIQKRIAAAEAEILTARQQVTNLEKQLLAVSNPFSARPVLSEEEKERRSGGEGALERRERTQSQLEAARGRLKIAEKALIEARATR